MVRLAVHVSNSGKQHLTKTKNMIFYNDTVLKLCGWHGREGGFLCTIIFRTRIFRNA